MSQALPFRGASQDDIIGRRANARARLMIPASLVLLSATFRCRLDNLSRTGARVSVGGLPRCGEDGFLRCGELDVFCTVVWVRDDSCGLIFDLPLPKDNVIAMRNSAEDVAYHDRVSWNNYVRDWVGGQVRHT